MRPRELGGELGHLEASDVVVGAARSVCQCRGDVAFADSAGTCDQDVEMFLDPAHFAYCRQRERIELAREGRIEFFQRGVRDGKRRDTQSLLEALVGAIDPFVLDHQVYALLEAQRFVLGGVALTLQGVSHPDQMQLAQLLDDVFGDHGGQSSGGVVSVQK